MIDPAKLCTVRPAPQNAWTLAVVEGRFARPLENYELKEVISTLQAKEPTEDLLLFHNEH